MYDKTYCAEALHFDVHTITAEEKQMKRWFVFALQAAMSDSSVSTNDQQTLQCQNADKWELAWQEELQACESNQSWGPPITFPPGAYPVNLCFDYVFKVAGDGTPLSYKACHVYKTQAITKIQLGTKCFLQL